MWMPVYLNTHLFNKKVRFYLEAQPRVERTADSLFTFAQLRLRSSIGYQFNRSFAAYTGYAWCPDFHPYRNENRPYQDLLFGHVLLKRLQMVYRYRSEERFIKHVHGMSYRGRFKIRGAVPIREGPFYVIGSEELFVNFNHPQGGPQKGLDQWRSYTGLGRQFGRHLRAEAGYMMRYAFHPGATPRKIDHAFITRLLINY